MEPCLFRHGKFLSFGDVISQTIASMEPCLFRHGKEADRLVVLEGLQKLQWSHVFSDMVRRRWGHEYLQRAVCFNGAMSFQTW